MPFDRSDPTNLTSVIEDQTLRNTEQCFELLEVCILGITDFVHVRSEMNRCLHCR